MSAIQSGTWFSLPVKRNATGLGKCHREPQSDGVTFYFNRWIIDNTITGSKHPWRLKNKIELTNLTDKQQPKRFFEELRFHNIPAALIFRAGQQCIAANDEPMFDLKKHVEWWLHFETSADRTAAILLL